MSLQCKECKLAKAIPPKIPLYGPYNVKDLEPGKTYYWCSCGLSKTQPFCDNSHREAPVQIEVEDTEAVTAEGEPKPKKTITACFKAVAFKARDQTLHQLCGCKYTRSPPFCDGIHIRIDIPPTKPPCTCAKAPSW